MRVFMPKSRQHQPINEQRLRRSSTICAMNKRRVQSRRLTLTPTLQKPSSSGLNKKAHGPRPWLERGKQNWAGSCEASVSVGALLRSVASLAPGATRAQSAAKSAKDIVGAGVRARTSLWQTQPRVTAGAFSCAGQARQERELSQLPAGFVGSLHGCTSTSHSPLAQVRPSAAPQAQCWADLDLGLATGAALPQSNSISPRLDIRHA